MPAPVTISFGVISLPDDDSTMEPVSDEEKLRTFGDVLETEIADILEEMSVPYEGLKVIV